MRMILSSLAALALFLLLAAIGGGHGGIDHDIILWWAGWRASYPGGVSALVAFTQLGGAIVLLALVAAGTGWLLHRRRAMAAASLAATTVGGRLVEEGLKLLFARERPSVDAHPVVVHSYSFPSAHAANSMITFLALALWLAPERLRLQAATGAVLLALMVGASRPMLGVHWPSDVAGGWLFGAAWTLWAWNLSRGRAQSAA